MVLLRKSIPNHNLKTAAELGCKSDDMNKLPGIKIRTKKNTERSFQSLILGVLAFIPTYMLIRKLAYIKFPTWAYSLIHNYKTAGVVFVDLLFLTIPVFLLNAVAVFFWFKLFANPSYKSKVLYLVGCILPVLAFNFTSGIESTLQRLVEWPHIAIVIFAPFLGALMCIKLK